MPHWILEPWPWYVSGPLIGLMVPLLYFLGNKSFGISSSLRHICAACMPGNVDFFKYNWKKEFWSVLFVAGILIGGTLTRLFFSTNEPVEISPSTREALGKLGISDFQGFMPSEIFGWESLLSFKGLILVVLGGFMVGFGSRYANGCTSGHAITGLSNFQLASLVAVVGFFIGGLTITHLILPMILS